jgi:uncharacterized protein
MANKPPIFVDTGYVIALLDATDVYHDVARSWQRRVVDRPHVITTAVLTELGDGFAAPGDWVLYRAFLKELTADTRVEIVDVGRSILDRAIDLRDARRDRDWGLTDCESFVVMLDRNITEALACDRHFVQAGFQALLLVG